MGTITIYAIKSAICLTLLFFPFSLLLRRQTFFSFNRFGLLLIIVLSLLVPCLDVPLWNDSLDSLLAEQRQAVIEVGMPVAIMGGSTDPASQAVSGSSFGWAAILVYTYFLGLLVSLVSKGWQLYRLRRFIKAGCLWTDVHDGVHIYCHAGETGAFSWMRSIVVGEADSDPNSPVMLHEMAHVRRHHSWDALLVAAMEVVQWFNPCIWMLDISLREIHEYEADDAVLRRGITARNYQLLLIKNAVRGSRYAFANAFNHSLLKKRITMMMKKKSNRWARMRLLYVVPVTLIVLSAFASKQFVAQTTPFNDHQSDPMPTSPVSHQEKDVPDEVQQETSVPAIEEVIAPVEVTDTVKPGTKKEEPVYEVAEVMPEYPGGMNELLNYLSTNIHYPEIAQQSKVQGRYVVSFIVTDEGKVTDVEIASRPKYPEAKTPADSPEEEAKRVNQEKSLQAMEEEALRVVKAMPAWTPGKDKGKPVNCHFSLPIAFRLN